MPGFLCPSFVFRFFHHLFFHFFFWIFGHSGAARNLFFFRKRASSSDTFYVYNKNTHINMMAHASSSSASSSSSSSSLFRRSKSEMRRSKSGLKRSLRSAPVPSRAAVMDNADVVGTSTSGIDDGKKKNKAIVVGAGVGGLGMASRLAHAGYEVTLLEKNDSVGGRCRSEQFDSEYRFDTGPSLLLLPDRYREQFKAVGEKFEDYVTIERCDPAYRAHFGDHTTLDLMYDAEKMRKQLDDVEEGAGGAYLDWLGRARASLDYGVAAFIDKDANSVLDFVKM